MFEGAPVVGGAKFAADTISGEQVPKSKLQYGPNGTGVDVTSTTPLPVGGGKGAIIDRSGVTAAISAPVDVMAANPGRQFLFVQNPLDATSVLYLNLGANASTSSKVCIELAPGGAYEMSGNFISTDRVSVASLVLNHKYIAKEG